MQDVKAIGVLSKVLEDVRQEPMVRHEAAEAMGAIGAPEVLPLLEKYKNDPVTEVAETCAIALARVQWLRSGQTVEDNNPYASVDPSPPAAIKSVAELKQMYLDDKEDLFERYRAMFGLRNIKGEESVLALTEGPKDASALFRQEVAFVLEHLQKPCSIPYLKQNLEDKNKNEVVCHERAEALGVIATEECIKILKNYVANDKRVVKESCEIALDMCEYENSPKF